MFHSRSLRSNAISRCLAATLLLLAAVWAVAQSQYEFGSPWPKFHETNNNAGTSVYHGCTGVMKWAFPTQGEIEASPAIGADGTIYVTSDDGTLRAINPTTGLQKWSFGPISGFPNYAMGDSPCLGADGTVYVGADTGSLYAIDGATGAEKWSYFVGAYIVGTPVIGASGTIYVEAADVAVYGINPDGTLLWKTQENDLGDCETAPAIDSNGTLYVETRWDPVGLVALNGSTGAIVWDVSELGSIYSSPAIGAGGVLYFGSDDGDVYAIDTSTGTVKWSFPTAGSVDGSPVIDSSGNVYIGSDDGNLYSLNGQTGAENWSFSTGASNQYEGLALAGDGTLYAGCTDHNLYALNSSTGAQEWHFTTGSEIDASPSIGSDGTVYIGSEDSNLYALSTVTVASLSCSPSSVPGGSSAEGTVQASFAAPAGYTVGLTSSNPIVSVPPSVQVPANGVSATFTVKTSTANIDVPVTLTASLGASTLQTTVTVMPAGLSNCYISPSSVTGGASTRGVVQLTGVSATAKVISLSTGSGDISAPATVTVGARLGGASFAITTSIVSSNEQDTLTATMGSVTLHATVTLEPVTLASCSISPNSVVGGLVTRGVVQLAGVAEGTVVVTLSTTGGISAPSSVTVPTGLGAVSFAINTTPVSATVQDTVTASFGGVTEQGVVTVNPSPIADIYASPSGVTGGYASNGVVQLEVPAGPSGDLVSLQSGSANAVVPAGVTVAAGKKGASFPITTSIVSSSQGITITATLGSSSEQTTLTLDPAPIVNLYASPSTVTGGLSTKGVVQLGYYAGPSGNKITMFTNNANVIVPSTVTVPAGAKGVSFTITTTAPVSGPLPVVINAQNGSSSQHTIVTVNPYLISNFYVSPGSVVGGTSTRGVIQLAGPAGPDGNTISLASFDGHVSVPSSVVIPAGATGVSFPITTSAVTATDQVTLEAVYSDLAGATVTTTMTLTP